MGLSLEEFVAASKPRRMECAVAVLLRSLTAKDRDVLTAALAAPKGQITHSAIEAILKANGHAVTQGTVGRHRNKQCACAG